jgi:hypothetical protein
LGRPEVDTLKDSKYADLKELRFRADGGVWRVAFAFDPQTDAILLVAGDKSGVSEKSFISGLLRKPTRGTKNTWITSSQWSGDYDTWNGVGG